jgi:hypothetical protein
LQDPIQLEPYSKLALHSLSVPFTDVNKLTVLTDDYLNAGPTGSLIKFYPAPATYPSLQALANELTSVMNWPRGAQAPNSVPGVYSGLVYQTIVLDDGFAVHALQFDIEDCHFNDNAFWRGTIPGGAIAAGNSIDLPGGAVGDISTTSQTLIPLLNSDLTIRFHTAPVAGIVSVAIGEGSTHAELYKMGYLVNAGTLQTIIDGVFAPIAGPVVVGNDDIITLNTFSTGGTGLRFTITHAINAGATTTYGPYISAYAGSDRGLQHYEIGISDTTVVTMDQCTINSNDNNPPLSQQSLGFSSLRFSKLLGFSDPATQDQVQEICVFVSDIPAFGDFSPSGIIVEAIGNFSLAGYDGSTHSLRSILDVIPGNTYNSGTDRVTHYTPPKWLKRGLGNHNATSISSLEFRFYTPDPVNETLIPLTVNSGAYIAGQFYGSKDE